MVIISRFDDSNINDLLSVKPRIDKKSFSPSVQLKKGHSLSLDIKFTGEPNPVATWTRTGKVSQLDDITLTCDGSLIGIGFHTHTHAHAHTRTHTHTCIYVFVI